jgi:hypothetical protein
MRTPPKLRIVARDGVASAEEMQADYERSLERRPTPQTTIEAILYCVRTRGVEALNEPENIERLSRCDDAAKTQINQRIAKLVAAKEQQDA